MALNVKFLKGTSAQYNASSKTSTTFYFVDDSDLYLGNIKLSNAADLASAVSRIATNETDIADIKASLEALIGGESGSISEMIFVSIRVLARYSSVFFGTKSRNICHTPYTKAFSVTRFQSSTVSGAKS